MRKWSCEAVVIYYISQVENASEHVVRNSYNSSWLRCCYRYRVEEDEPSTLPFIVEKVSGSCDAVYHAIYIHGGNILSWI